MVAARQLAVLHAYFAAPRDRLLRCDFLLRLDRTYLHGWAERAVAAVAQWSAELAADLEAVVRDYDRVSSPLEQYPPTLVHNDLAPKNVLALRAASPPRIAFVDWEMAGIGCGLLDLVHLKHGLDPATDRRMCEVYREAWRENGGSAIDDELFSRSVTAGEVHSAMYRVAHGRAWGVTHESIAAWVGEVRQLFARL
jgi:aminoglycoside phosphotransferase (APT) family kinase protein